VKAIVGWWLMGRLMGNAILSYYDLPWHVEMFYCIAVFNDFLLLYIELN
jgi:hypothetical protein